MLNGSSEGLRGGAASIAQELLQATTDVAADLLSADTAQLASPLCQVPRWILRPIIPATSDKEAAHTATVSQNAAQAGAWSVSHHAQAVDGLL